MPISHSVSEIVEALTFAGVEVEGVQQRGTDFDKVIVAQIDSFEPHPNADRLSVCRVNDGLLSAATGGLWGKEIFLAGDKVPIGFTPERFCRAWPTKSEPASYAALNPKGCFAMARVN